MALPDLTKLWEPAPGEIRDMMLNNYRLGLIAAGVANPALQPGTEPYIRFSNADDVLQAIFNNIQLAQNNSSETNATGTALEAIRIAIGLPEVPASPAAGKVLVQLSGTGNRTFVNGLAFLTANGKRGQVFGTQFNVSNGGSVNVITVDLGFDCNQAPGSSIKWVSPPLNVLTTATVDPDGLTGGTDLEDDEHKRERIANRRQNLPAAGNWGFVKETAESATNAVQAAFVYSALGGPGSLKCTVIKAMNPTAGDFTRVVPVATVQLVTGTVLGNMPAPVEIAIGTVDEDLTDITIGLSLPDNSSFGDATGWNDLTPWPLLDPTDGGRVIVVIATDSTHITVSALFPPVANSNSLAWWNPTTQSFVTSNITNVSGSAAFWALTLDTPLTGVAVNDYISANAVNGATYATTWQAQMNLMGPGENTTDAAVLTANRARGFRRPFTSEQFPSSLTTKQLAALIDANTEIQNADYLHLSQTTPIVPASVASNPRILRLNRFAVYPL